MTDQAAQPSAVQKMLDRIPQRLRRVLIVATALYFLGFLWTFTGGNLARLFIPFQWEIFFTNRQMAEAFNGHWFLYGTSLLGLIINWLVMLAVIAGGYYAYVWVVKSQKSDT